MGNYASSKEEADQVVNEITKEGGKAIAVQADVAKKKDTLGVPGSDFEKQAIAQTPLGRIGQPGDIAPAVAFLASSDSSWVTGEILHVAGGLR